MGLDREALTALVDKTQNAVLIVRLNGPGLTELLFANQAFWSVIGYPEAPPGFRLSELRIDAIDPQVLGGIRDFLAGARDRGEITLRHRDGGRLEFEWQAIAIDVPLGPASRVFLVMRDVTAQRRAERALRDRQRFIERLTDAAPGLMFMFELSEPRILFINDSVSRTLGWSRDELLAMGKRVAFEILAPDELPGFAKYLMRRIRPDAPESVEVLVRFKRRDGEQIWVQAVDTVYERGPDGAPRVVLVSGQDVTAKRRASEFARERDRVQALAMLAGSLAHDFRNMLTTVVGNLELLSESEPLSRSARELVAEVLVSAEDAVQLTRELQAFTRPQTMRRTLTRVGPLLERSLRFAFRGSGLREGLEVPPGLWPAAVDAGQIRQVMHNLLLNAREALGERGGVTVRAQNRHDDHGEGVKPWVFIEVTDTGEGMSAELAARVFEPYITTKPRGSGLGLASCKKIVVDHGGRIELETAPGQGATFRLWLPAQPEAEVRAEPVARERGLPSRGRVLVMDDEEFVLRTVSRTLESLGYIVEVVRHGAECIARYRSVHELGGRFDLVVLDLTIRWGIGGLETLAALRAFDPSVLAIVHSAYGDSDVMSQPQHYGFAGAVEKPAVGPSLEQMITRLINARNAGRATPLP